MKILLFTSKKEDYLEDSVIHGFKSKYGRNVQLYPEKPIMYSDFNSFASIRGNGFTLYGLLDPTLKHNLGINFNKDLDKFDLIVFTSIYNQFNIYYNLYHKLKDKTVWIMDGSDTDIIFPYMLMHKRKVWYRHTPHKKHLYFKREFTTNSIRRLYYGILPSFITDHIKKHINFKHISFGIPEVKIIKGNIIKNKKQLFATHIVDKEIANKLKAETSYVFDSEDSYYEDIKKSKYGITTKRAGWDCLRHYEIAANGAVICFKDLHLKPIDCAPFDLIPNYNCLSYSNYEDLITQLNKIDEEQYIILLRNSLNWIKTKNTTSLIDQLIATHF